MTKLDVLDGLKELRLCVGYKLDGKTLDVLPRGSDAVASCVPIYETFPGWSETTVGIQKWDELPKAAQTYLKRVEEVACVPIAMVSTGPDRNETILLQHPFEA
jgi:adenylosuccinate synthase